MITARRLTARLARGAPTNAFVLASRVLAQARAGKTVTSFHNDVAGSSKLAKIATATSRRDRVMGTIKTVYHDVWAGRETSVGVRLDRTTGTAADHPQRRCLSRKAKNI